MSLQNTPLQPHSRRMFLHVIANRCRGPRKGAPFAGRGAPRERCPALAFGRSWAWRTLGRRHGGLWGDEAWQSASPAQGVHCGNVLTNVATPPPSACHCEPVRTLVWQSVTPQRNPASWHHFGQIRSTFPHSPKVLLSAMHCRRRCGLPRRFAPRNDMLKLAGCPHRQGRCTR